MSLDFPDVIAALRTQGWTLEQLNASHWQARPPDASKPVVHFADSGDRRAIRNTIAQLRKSGFLWGGDKDGDNDHDRPSPSKMICSTCGGAGAIAGRGIRVACPECVAITSPDPEQVVLQPATVAARTATSSEDPLDVAYRELRDARAYLDLAIEHATETAAALEEAQRRKAEAGAEWSKALEAFEQSEQRFLSTLRRPV